MCSTGALLTNSPEVNFVHTTAGSLKGATAGLPSPEWVALFIKVCEGTKGGRFDRGIFESSVCGIGSQAYDRQLDARRRGLPLRL